MNERPPLSTVCRPPVALPPSVSATTSATCPKGAVGGTGESAECIVRVPVPLWPGCEKRKSLFEAEGFDMYQFEVFAWSGGFLTLRDDLRKLKVVRLDVTERDRLSKIADRAQRELGVHWDWVYYHFVTEPDASGRRYQAPSLSPYVAEDGKLTWDVGQLKGIRVSDAMRTKEEGLFVGDPFAFIMEEPQGGDGVFPGWDDVATFLVRAGAVYGGIQAIQQSIKLLQSLFEQYKKQWELRHATPYRLLWFILTRDSWNYAKLARLLHISLSNTVDLLTSLGYEQDREDAERFEISQSVPQAKLRRELEKEVLHGDPREWRDSYWRTQGTEPPGSG